MAWEPPNPSNNNFGLEYHLKNTDAKPPYETLEIGTPLDYTNDVYRVYFEVPGSTHESKKIITAFLAHI